MKKNKRAALNHFGKLSRSKKNSILFLLALFTVSGLSAQKKTLRVKVSDSRNEIINRATAVLYQLPDTVIVSQKVLNRDSYFEVIENTAYLLSVSATGKNNLQQKIFVRDSSLDVNIILTDKTSDLSAVTIVSKKPLITQEDDKTIVDATNLSASSTNAFEVIEKTPAVIIDQDGNVYLNSTTPATIFINGREMKLSSADLSSLLKSLPANSVSKIEILRSPSAKFDAASSGGILNIVLKKGVKLGSSGSANLSYFQGVYGTFTSGVNFNKSIGKANTYASYQYTNKNSFEKLTSDRSVAAAVVSQQSYTTYPAKTHYFSSGFDIALNQKWNAGYDLRFSGNRTSSSALNNIDIYLSPANTLTGKNSSAISNGNTSTFIQNTFYSKYKIDTTGSEWTNNIEYSYFRYNNDQFYDNFSFLPANPTVTGDGVLDNRKNILVFQSDLVKKFPRKLTLELGAKFSNSKSNNSAVYFKDEGDGNRKPDLFQTNTFRYHENILAAYLQVSKTFWGFTLKPGLRFENTDIAGNQLIPKDTSFSIKRNDVFPYVFLKHNLFKIFGQVLVGSAIFRKSIRRPYYESLNPYPRYIDQYLYEVGNPRLRPQFTTNYEFNVTYNEIPVLAVGINETRDIFSNVTYQDNATKIALRTFDNLGKNKEFYARLIAGIPPGGKYFFYVGGLYNYNEYRGFYQNQPLNYDRGSFTFFTYHEFKPSKKLTFSMQGFLRTKGLQNLYELNNFGGLTISANKSILHKKGNIILAVNDVFRTNYVTFRLSQADILATGRRYNDTRRVGLTFRYNFGFKPKEEKKPEFGSPVEGN